ncbi:hypothetical protein ACO22_00063 [Paracoccidioides brasiliensis]|uniref:DUF1740-domain-containing protein n=1 Tax=Paracoccidioides brasiliensis TaxID=121759 RepID=A0A1D2JQ40_PARBR|nr:hypothetical protein ACO22_00063 [Paracoccidioides brasiliensis]
MESGDEKEKKPVPKFASFRPKTSPPASSSAKAEIRSYHEKHRASSKNERLRHESRRSRHKSHSSLRKDDQDRHGEHHSRIGREIESLATKPPEIAKQLASEGDEQEFFFIDREGDNYNVTYGTLHHYSIPEYYRSGSGRILGLPTSHRIDCDDGDANTVVIGHRVAGYDSSKQKYREFLRRQTKGGMKILRVRPEPESNPAIDYQKDFLPLNSGGSRKRRGLHGGMFSTESEFNDDPTVDYRSIKGKFNPSEQLPEDLEAVSELDLASDDENALKRNDELSRKVEEHPYDIDGWLQLIRHQDSLVGFANSDGQRILTTAEKRSVADIKISMYEKALNKMPLKARRDRLLLGMMEEASILYDTKTVSNKWKDVLQVNPDYISLWIKYLDTQQTRFVNFTYEQCRSIFIDCLRINRTRKNSPEPNVINIYLILRLSRFMREAGFVEHAVALWQAVLEFNFFQPKSLDITKNAATSAFCEFWDSEAPRIGEIGARGWDSGERPSPDSKSDPASREIDERSIFESWEQSERQQMRYSRLPARTLDDVQDDDPYRVILSSDINDFLLPLSDSLDLLIGAFMIFCGLPPLTLSENADILVQWRRDPFIRNNLLDNLDDQSSKWFSEVIHGPDETVKPKANTFPLPTFANNLDTLFGNENWFSELREWQISYMNDLSAVDGEWVRRTLRHLVNRLPQHDDLAEYSVALEFTSNPKESKKYTKGLLKKRSSNLKLYNAYALIEFRSGQIATAEHVWTTALSMCSTFKDEDKISSIILWRTWIWEVLADHNNDRAVQLLLSISNGATDLNNILADVTKSTTVISPAAFLKTQMFLKTTQEYGLTSRNPNIFVNSVECHALLVYFSEKLDIEASMNVFETVHSRLLAHRLENTIFNELLLQAKVKLLYHHTTATRLFKPSVLRSKLTDAISHFPQNTLFLSLFMWNESRFRIEDRVRSILRQHTITPMTQHDESKSSTTDFSIRSTLISHLFSIYAELHRGVSAGSTVHSARAALESAVTSPSGQSSASTWKLYLLFELALSQWGRAREVLYRAIRACPWAKELVLLAFRERGLREKMGQDELRKVWNVLVEKELRVHVDLEEWFEENGEKGGRGARVGEARDLPFDMPEDVSDEDG